MKNYPTRFRLNPSTNQSVIKCSHWSAAEADGASVENTHNIVMATWQRKEVQSTEAGLTSRPVTWFPGGAQVWEREIIFLFRFLSHVTLWLCTINIWFNTITYILISCFIHMCYYFCGTFPINERSPFWILFYFGSSLHLRMKSIVHSQISAFPTPPPEKKIKIILRVPPHSTLPSPYFLSPGRKLFPHPIIPVL